MRRGDSLRMISPALSGRAEIKARPFPSMEEM